jgi:hypothetical protein
VTPTILSTTQKLTQQLPWILTKKFPWIKFVLSGAAGLVGSPELPLQDAQASLVSNFLLLVSTLKVSHFFQFL